MNTVSKVIITTIIVVIVVIGGWWLIASMSSNNEANNESTGNGTSNGGQADQNTDQEVTATIAYDGTQFMPSSIVVQPGDVIEVVNNATNVLYFASDEHPLHRDNSELNVGDIQPGASATFTISSPGTWGYHDHYNASAGGEILVEE